MIAMPLCALLCSLALPVREPATPNRLAQTPEPGFMSIFNGKNLKDWTPKITGYPLGENFGNTFRVEDGAITVGYEAYDKFNNRYGHLFYKQPYSDYILRLEYRFIGKQSAEGPGWAYRNSGIMLHCQDPKTMTKDQEFPVSAEFQFLGGDPTGERPTGSVCSPGTHITLNGVLNRQHVNNSNSVTYRGDQWVTAEAEVHGHGDIIHRINGVEVLRYTNVILDSGDATAKPLIVDGNVKVSSGYISLQSESHPVQFRNIRIKKLPTSKVETEKSR